MICYWLYTVFQ